MRLLHEHIGDCLSNMYTTHEDVELGRCVRKFVGVPCTWSYEVSAVAAEGLVFSNGYVICFLTFLS